MSAVERLALYEPLVMAALDPEDSDDSRQREWGRALVQRASEAVGTDGFESAIAGFIETWSEVAWMDMPAPARQSIMRDGAGLVAELLAAGNGDQFITKDLLRLKMPVLLLGGDRSPALAGRILDRLEQRLPNPERYCFGGLGHMGPVMASAVVADKLRAFFG